MRCPSHRNMFLRQVGHGVGLGLKTHSCEQCAGIWIDLAEFKDRLPGPTSVEQPKRKYLGSRACPKCEARMEVWTMHGVDVDVCEGCEGIWFDKGELQKMAQAPKSKPRRKNDNRVFDALDLIPDEPLISGAKVLGETVADVLKTAPDVAESVASGALDIAGGIFFSN